MMTWQQKITVVIGLSAMCFVIYLMAVANMTTDTVEYEDVKIVGDAESRGIFDPSVEPAPALGGVLLAYTGLEAPRRKMTAANPLEHQKLMNEMPKEPMTSVSIAFRQKGSKSWEYKKTPFKARIDDLVTEEGSGVWAKGFWRYEQPSLIHDPKDKGREWKLFAYKYFWSGDAQIARRTGAIVLKSAQDPAGEWSREDWLFSSAPGQPPSPYESLILLHLNRLHPSLETMTGYSDPGAWAGGGAIFLTLAAFENNYYTEYVHFFASADHGQSWQFINTPFTPDILKKMGYTRVGAPAIFTHKGKKLLSVTFGDAKMQHKGVFIFEFDDLAKGTLKKDPATGLPAVVNKIPLISVEGQATPIGGGPADYDDSAAGDGVIFSEVPGYQAMAGFRIFASKKPPL